ncbi:hypothetical protein PINS_up002854 [Pythium insidiosum]|nr:hypothetical protein PINS_up002854 [Pythium insidiosum]
MARNEIDGEADTPLACFAKKSKICLVDLAGSERADISGASGQRLKEASSINRSLSTLADVISALARRPTVSSSATAFVPYRNSVLTRLLKESLGGNARTVMLAAISPCCIHYEETLSTLKYIERAKNVITTAKINTENSLDLVTELRREISELRAKLQETAVQVADTSLAKVTPLPLAMTSNEVTTVAILHQELSRHTTPMPLTQPWKTGSEKAIKLDSHSDPTTNDDDSPLYSTTLSFNEKEKSRLEREIAKLRLQLKKKDRALEQQAQEQTQKSNAVENQSAEDTKDRDSQLQSALRRQALLLNVAHTYRRLASQRLQRALFKWVGSVQKSPHSTAEPQSSLEALAAEATPVGSPRQVVSSMCAFVVGDLLFDGQLCREPPPRESPPMLQFEGLNTLESLAGTTHACVSEAAIDLDVEIQDEDEEEDILLALPSSLRRNESAVVTLEVPGISDSELDRVLEESMRLLAAAEADAATKTPTQSVGSYSRCDSGASPESRWRERYSRATTALAKHKQQSQTRVVKSLDVVDTARKYLGPTLRRLRQHEDRQREKRCDTSTAMERWLIRHVDGGLVRVAHELNELRAAISALHIKPSVDIVHGFTLHDDNENEVVDVRVLQRKLALYESVEALLTVFCLHVLRRACDQLCAPVTMALVHRETLGDQLSSLQTQLRQTELWRDALVPVINGNADTHVAVLLAELYGLSERLRATWFAIDQKHRRQEALSRTERTTTTATVSRLMMQNRELERRVKALSERHEELATALMKSQDHAAHQAERVIALEDELLVAEARLRDSEHVAEALRHVNDEMQHEMSKLEVAVKEHRVKRLHEPVVSDSVPLSGALIKQQDDADIVELTVESLALRCELVAMAAERNEVREALIAERMETTRLHNETSALHEQVSLLTAEMELKESKLHEVVATHRDELSDLRQQQANLAQQLVDMEFAHSRRLKTLKKKCKDRKLSLQTEKSHADELKRRLQATVNELHSASSTLPVVTANCKDCEDHVEGDLPKRVAELENAVKAKKMECEDLRSQLDAAVIDVRERGAKLAEASTELQSLRQANQDLLNSSCALNTELVQLRDEVRARGVQFGAQQSEIERLDRLNQELQDELKEERQEHKKMLCRFMNTEQMWAEETRAMRLQADDTLRLERDNLEEQIRLLSGGHKVERDSLKSEMTSAQSKCKEQAETISILLEDVNELRSQLSQAETRCKETMLRVKMAEMSAQEAQLRGDVPQRDLVDTMKRHEYCDADLESEIIRTTIDKMVVQCELSASLSVCEELKRGIVSLADARNESDRIAAELESTKAGLAASERRYLEAQALIKAQADRLQLQLLVETTPLSDELAIHREEVSALRVKHEELLDELKRQIYRNERLTQERDELIVAVDTFEIQRQQLQQSIESKQEEFATMKTKLANDAISSQEEASSLFAELARERDHSSTLHSQLELIQSQVHEGQERLVSLELERSQAAAKQEELLTLNTSQERQLSELRNQLSHRVAQCDSLTSELARLNSDLQRAQDDLEASTSTNYEAQLVIDQLRSERDDLASKVVQLETVAASSASRLESVKIELEETTQSLQTAALELSESRAQHDELVARCAQLTSQVEDVSAKLEAAVGRSTELASALETASTTIEGLQARAAMAESELESATETVNGLTSERDDMQRTQAYTSERVADLERELKQATTRLQAIQSSADIAPDRCAELEEALRVADDSLASYRAERDAMQHLQRNMETENSALLARVTSLTEEVSRLQRQAELAATERADLLRETVSLSELIAVKANDVVVLEKARDGFVDRNTELEQQITLLHERVEFVEHEKVTLENELSATRDHITDLQLQIDDVNQRLEEAEATKCDLSEAASRAESDCKRLNTELIAVQSQLNAERAQAETYRRDLRVVETELRHFQDEVETLAAEKNRLCCQRDDLALELQTCQSECKRLIDTNTSLHSETSRLHTELTVQEEALATERAFGDRLSSQLQCEQRRRDDLEEKLAVLVLEKTHSERLRADEVIASTMDSMVLRCELNVSSGECIELRKLLNIADTDASSVRDERDHLISELQNTTASFTQLQQQFSTVQMALQSEKREVELELATQSTRLAATTDESENLRQEIHRMQGEMDRLMHANDRLSGERDTLEQAFNVLQLESKAQKDTIAMQQEHAANYAVEMNAVTDSERMKNISLIGQLKDERRLMSELQQRYHTLETEMASTRQEMLQFREQLSHRVAQCDSLTSELARLNSDLQRAQDDLEASTSTNYEAQLVIDQLRSERDDLASKVVQLETVAASSASRLESVKIELEETTQSLQTAALELSESRAQHDELVARCAQLTSQVEDVSAKLEAAVGRSTELASALETASTTIEGLQARAAMAESQRRDMAELVCKLQHELEDMTLSQAMTDATERVERDELASNLQSIERQLVSERDEHAARSLRYEDQINALEQQLTERFQSIQDLKCQLERSEQRCLTTDRENEALLARLVATSADADAQLKATQEREGDLRMEISTITRERDQQLQQLAASRKKVEDLCEHEATLKITTANLQKELAMVQEQCSLLFEEVSQLQNMRNELQSERKTLSEQLINVEANVAALKAANMDALQQNESLQLENATLKCTVDAFDIERSTHRALVVESEQKILTLTQLLESDRATSTTRIDELEEALANAATRRDEMDAQLTALTARREELEAALAASIEREQGATQQLRSVTERLEALTARRDELEAVVSQSVSRRDELEAKLTAAVARRMEIECVLREEVKLREKAYAEMEQGKQWSETLSLRLEERDMHFFDLVTRYEELQNAQSDGDEQRRELESRVTLMVDHSRELEARFEMLDTDREEARFEQRDAEERYNTLAAEYWAQGLAMAKIEEDLTLARRHEVTARAALMEREEAFAQLLVERTMDLNQHNAEVRCVRDELKIAQQRVESLESEIAMLTTQSVVNAAVIAQQDSELSQSSRQLLEWEQRYSDATAQIIEQTSELSAARQQVQELQQYLTDHQARTQSLEQALKQEQCRLRQAMEQNAEMTQRLLELQTRYDLLHSAFGEAAAQGEARIDWEGEYNAMMSDMHVRIQELQEQLQEMTAHAEDWEERCKSQAVADAAKLLRLEVQLADRQTQIANLESSVNAANEAVRRLSSELAQERSRTDRLAREIDHKAADVRGLTGAVTAVRRDRHRAKTGRKWGAAEKARAEQEAKQLVLKHLNSLDTWFAQTILQEEAPAPADAPTNETEQSLDAIPESLFPSDDEDVYDFDDDDIWQVDSEKTKAVRVRRVH